MESKEAAADSAKVDINQFTIILDEVLQEVRLEDIQELLETNKVKHSEVVRIQEAEYTSFGIENYMQYSRQNNRNTQRKSKN